MTLWIWELFGRAQRLDSFESLKLQNLWSGTKCEIEQGLLCWSYYNPTGRFTISEPQNKTIGDCTTDFGALILWKGRSGNSITVLEAPAVECRPFYLRAQFRPEWNGPRWNLSVKGVGIEMAENLGCIQSNNEIDEKTVWKCRLRFCTDSPTQRFTILFFQNPLALTKRINGWILRLKMRKMFSHGKLCWQYRVILKIIKQEREVSHLVVRRFSFLAQFERGELSTWRDWRSSP